MKTSKTKLFIILFTLVAAACVGWFVWNRRKAEAVVYKELTLQKSDLTVTIQSTGTVQPENRLEIKPPIAGRVEQVLVKEGQKVFKGQLLAWMSSTERAALLDAARAQGADEVKRWEELYRPTPVVAPISGTIILKNIEAGQTFTATDAVLVMSDHLTVKAQVDETDLAQIKLKQKARIVLDAYPNLPIEAKVDEIAYEAKTVNNVTTYVVTVLPNETPETMRAGMTANVTFTIDSRKQVWVIPNDAIQNGENNSVYVLVRGPKPEASPTAKPIELGISDGKRTEVLSGLSEQDTVLTTEFKAKEARNKASSPFNFAGPRGGKRR